MPEYLISFTVALEIQTMVEADSFLDAMAIAEKDYSDSDVVTEHINLDSVDFEIVGAGNEDDPREVR